jgi:hypothetical protein
MEGDHLEDLSTDGRTAPWSCINMEIFFLISHVCIERPLMQKCIHMYIYDMERFVKESTTRALFNTQF